MGKIAVSTEKVREMVARGCSFKELVDNFEEPEANDKYDKIIHSYLEGGEKDYTVTFYYSKEAAVIALAYEIAEEERDKYLLDERTNEENICNFSLEIINGDNTRGYSIKVASTDTLFSNCINSVTQFLFSDIENEANINILVPASDTCNICKFYRDKNKNDRYILDSKIKKYFKGEWCQVHFSCYLHEVKNYYTYEALEVLTVAKCDAAILTLNFGPKIWKRRKVFNKDTYLYTRVLNDTQYFVGQLSEKAEKEAMQGKELDKYLYNEHTGRYERNKCYGSFFAVASFDHNKKEYTRIYRFNINCKNEEVFTDTLNYVYEYLDIRKPLEAIITPEFIYFTELRSLRFEE